jgi:hypothetical protein
MAWAEAIRNHGCRLRTPAMPPAFVNAQSAPVPTGACLLSPKQQRDGPALGASSGSDDVGELAGHETGSAGWTLPWITT